MIRFSGNLLGGRFFPGRSRWQGLSLRVLRWWLAVRWGRALFRSTLGMFLMFIAVRWRRFVVFTSRTQVGASTAGVSNDCLQSRSSIIEGASCTGAYDTDAIGVQEQSQREKPGAVDRGGCAPPVLELRLPLRGTRRLSPRTAPAPGAGNDWPTGATDYVRSLRSQQASNRSLSTEGAGRRAEAERGGGYTSRIIVETGEGGCSPLETLQFSQARSRSHSPPNGGRAPGVPPIALPVSPSPVAISTGNPCTVSRCPEENYLVRTAGGSFT